MLLRAVAIVRGFKLFFFFIGLQLWATHLIPGYTFATLHKLLSWQTFQLLPLALSRLNSLGACGFQFTLNPPRQLRNNEYANEVMASLVTAGNVPGSCSLWEEREIGVLKVASRSNRDIGLETDERKKGRRVDKNESSRCSTKPSAHFLETLSPQGGTETETRIVYIIDSCRAVVSNLVRV